LAQPNETKYTFQCTNIPLISRTPAKVTAYVVWCDQKITGILISFVY